MPDWEDVADVELLNAAQNGQLDAYGALYERYANSIFRFLYAHLNDRFDAEDLTEDVFLRAWRSLKNYREQGVPFAAYLYHIARNVMIDHHRRSKIVYQSVPLDDGHPAGEVTDPGHLIPNQMEHEELRALMEGLREDYREVLILRFLSGLSPEETAAIMERSVGAVRVLQHRALAAMRTLVADRYKDQ